MRLVTYRQHQEAARLGVVHNGLVVDVQSFAAHAGMDMPSTMLDFIDLGPTAVEVLTELLDEANASWFMGTSAPESNVTLLAPIPRPRKNIFGIGLNYTEHVAESARSLDTSKDRRAALVIFSKPPTAVIA